MPSPVLQFKRGLFANLPGLRDGEPGFTTDSYELYVGIDSTTQNNKFFGSHRYWTRETTSTGSGVNLVEGTNNGSSFITLKSPGSLAGITTYTFPASPIAANVLTTDADGGLSWTAVVSELTIGSLISGIGTFTNNVGFTTTTDNTLGNENTGAVQIDGGLGIAKNLTVKENLYVGGYAEFVGVVTFKGGTINIGDGNTDDINVGGEFISSLLPNTDDAHDLGSNAKRWRNLNAVSVATTNISITGLSTFTGAIDANGGADISGGETTLSSATVSDLTSGRVVLAGTSGALEDSANLKYSGAGLIVGAGGINVTGVSTFSADLVVNGITSVTQLSLSGTNLINFASSGTGNPAFTTRSAGTKVVLYPAIGGSTVDYSLGISASTLWNSIPENNSSFNFKWFGAETEVASLSGIGSLSVAGDIKVGGNDILASDGTTAITLSGADVTIAGDLRINGNDIKASDGTTAITLAGNDVTVADDLTVGGNLYVNGSTTQVNTAALTVEDRTIDLGIVNGSAPSGATTWDLGVLFNYNASGAAKKSAVIWEHVDSRFKFASVLTADTDGSTVDTPQLTVTTFAPIEIASLFVNDCAGASQVISCTGTTRKLENITIDCGTF